MLIQAACRDVTEHMDSLSGDEPPLPLGGDIMAHPGWRGGTGKPAPGREVGPDFESDDLVPAPAPAPAPPPVPIVVVTSARADELQRILGGEGTHPAGLGRDVEERLLQWLAQRADGEPTTR